ncbi:MAG: nitroreductase family protein [Candidatus Bathyarchaeia archaeon]
MSIAAVRNIFRTDKKYAYLEGLLSLAWRAMTIENEVLKAIRERRSVFIFTPEPVEDEKIQAVLESGRWAPSFRNSQPWEFIVVKDLARKRNLSILLAREASIHEDIQGAPAIIVTCVDPRKDSSHFIEDGAVATQNMALAAHSLGLASYWVGIFSPRDDKDSLERDVKKILSIPKEYRVVSLLPIGVPAHHLQKERKSLREITHYDQFSSIASSSLP